MSERHRRRMHEARVLALALAVPLAVPLAFAACDDAEPARRPTPSVATQPHATDYLYGLLREQITTDEPLAVQKRMVCETGRLENALGEDDARQRIDDVLDSVYTTPDEWATVQRLERNQQGGSFVKSGGICDSLNAIASRVAPLAQEPAASRTSAATGPGR